MVRFFLDDVEVFFPYDYVYPEQYAYMRKLKVCVDAKGHGVLEMPTGTGKTVALLSFLTSYQYKHPDRIQRILYCTRTVPEMEKTLYELQNLMAYRTAELQKDALGAEPQLVRRKKVLGIGMSARRNLCIHPEVCQEPDRDSLDEKCQMLTAPWVRQKEGAMDRDIEDCGSNLCEYFENYDRFWNVDFMDRTIYSIDELRRVAADFRLPKDHPTYPDRKAPFCPYFGARKLLHASDIVVLNYMYLLDPKVSNAVMGPNAFNPLIQKAASKPDAVDARLPVVVVMDEAHNVDNVAIEGLSVNLNMLTLDRARANITQLEAEVARSKATDQRKLQDEYDRLLKGLHTAGHIDSTLVETLACPLVPMDIQLQAVPGTIRKAELFLNSLSRIVRFLSQYLCVFDVQVEGPLALVRKMENETGIPSHSFKFFYDRLKSIMNTVEIANMHHFGYLVLVADFITLVGTYWEGFIIICEPYPDAPGIYDPLIQLACLDASIAMRPVVQGYNTVILTSGTISPLFLYPKLLDFEPVVTESFPMSLDRDCIRPLIVTKGADQVPLSSRFDLRDDLSIIRNYGTFLIGLCQTIPDGIVVFFTSYAYMEKVVAAWYELGVLAQILEHKLILLETKDVVSTTLALHNFRKASDAGRGAVFLSIARGKVSEGIDFDRHYGRCVVLFGVPYPYTLSRILKARLDFVREKFNVPEAEFLTFDAMRQASQCVGRVIRSKTDYGLMIFADARFARPDKRLKLPEWIQDRIDPMHMNLTTEEAITMSRRFLMEMSHPFQLTSTARLSLEDLQKREVNRK
ncbi:MAG: uncharacterized protein KVP18_004171 [Porospora cf. gigantea A]|uniref:uncharacterized protein n=1 Tax=Porospora cf. gigantea A TaxID=2853593 RepID=UPI003559888D|nr:MAG: hypothetical protein KVP18_004171 [Porospora cf. gigantea A]